jgi:hypothetical protein
MVARANGRFCFPTGRASGGQLLNSEECRLKNQKKSREHLRFTPSDIVRAINGVEAAGLQVYGVEITLTGAINIATQPPPNVSRQRPSRQPVADTQTNTNPPDETRLIKERA